MVSGRLCTASIQCVSFQSRERFVKGVQRVDKERQYDKQPCTHDECVVVARKSTIHKFIGESRPEDATHGKYKCRVGIGIEANETETSHTVRVRRNQTKLEHRKPTQQHRPDEVAPKCSQKKKPKDWAANH